MMVIMILLLARCWCLWRGSEHVPVEMVVGVMKRCVITPICGIVEVESLNDIFL